MPQPTKHTKRPDTDTFNQPPSLQPTPLFGKLGTGILTIVTIISFFAIQVITLLMALVATMFVTPNKIAHLENPLLLINSDGTILSVSIVFNLLLLCLYIWLIIKFRKKKPIDYLALHCSNNGRGHWKKIDWKVSGICFGLWLIFVMVSEALFYFFNHQPMDFMDVYFYSAEPLWLLFVAVIIIAPIYEELIFRGLLWQSIIEHINLPPIGTNTFNKSWLITSAITGGLFAMIHLQYDMLEMGSIFVFAILLGYARYRSGSLILPIALHIANNALAMVTYVWTLS